MNSPYHGGTHLPDLTVITPVFLDQSTPLFFVASRGHHADVGGTTPGSVPPDSRTIEEEGVLIEDMPLLAGGRLRVPELLALLIAGPHPAGSPEGTNAGDLFIGEGRECPRQSFSGADWACHPSILHDSARAAMRRRSASGVAAPRFGLKLTVPEAHTSRSEPIGGEEAPRPMPLSAMLVPIRAG
jgi:hypothetical protein